MEDFLNYHKKMFVVQAVVCAAAAIAILIVLPGDFPRFWGFVVGAAAQLAKFGLLDPGTIQRIAADPEHAAKTQLRATFLSLLLFCFAIAVVFLCVFNVWTMAIGIFLPRIVLLADAFIRPDPFKNKAERE